MMQRPPALPCFVWGLFVGLFTLGFGALDPSVRAADDDTLVTARRLWLAGKYAEAQEVFEALGAREPLAAALGIARCQASVGETTAAEKTLAAAVEQRPHADLHAAQAELAFHRGDYRATDEYVAASLKLAADQLLARWIQAERWRVSGQLDQALDAYKWFADYYNDHDHLDAEALLIVGRAAAQHARWRRLTDEFQFLVNELYAELVEREPADWRGHYEAGLLYLEKYNEAEASAELKAALKLNPTAADVCAALARLALQNYDLDDARRQIARALEINPRHLAAHWADVDAHLANFELADAVRKLEAARAWNPVSEETLGRLAAAYAVVDGIKPVMDDQRFGKLAAEVEARNPHPGAFYLAAAGVFDVTRKFPAAAQFYRLASEKMPVLLEPLGQLGLMEMRLGEEADARQHLEASFAADPFNVRVSNSLKVLDVLDGYAVLETAHFVIKFDRGKDEILARHMARYLEQHVYPALTKQFGFEPAGKSLFELFNRAKNTNGHGWFSARMVGLPYIGTVGACAGKMVAVASPNDMPEPFNWARVVKHEFVHVLNLQQSNFNIPHWYTEALAVQSEGYPRPQSWNTMLIERVPQGRMFNLETINLGFVRPKSSLDWQMAYCQAQLYAEYMLKMYGDRALEKMLQCYADNLDTRAALKRSFGVEQEAFEAGYLKHVQALVAELTAAAPPAESGKLAQLIRDQQAKPDDLQLAASLAVAQLGRKSYPEARKLAEMVLAKEPRHALAAYVLAKVRLVIGDDTAALELLTAAVDPKRPEPNSLGLLASLKLKAGDVDAAAELYQRAAQTWPGDAQWTKALARLYLKSGDNRQLTKVLEKLADGDADDLVMRKKLAYLALENKDYAAAARWAQESLYANVLDADCHRVLGEALVAQGQFAPAIEAYQDAVRLNPKQPGWRFALADAHLRAEQTAAARAVLKELLELQPEFPGARALLDGLDDQ